MTHNCSQGPYDQLCPCSINKLIHISNFKDNLGFLENAMFLSYKYGHGTHAPGTIWAREPHPPSQPKLTYWTPIELGFPNRDFI